jgi:two-component system NarL family response regulator
VKKSPLIRILIADDHLVVREGLTAILGLQKDFRVVGQAADGEEAIALYHRQKPDVMLVDLRMPKKNGFEVVTELSQLEPKPRIVVISTFDGDEHIRRSLTAGAKAYLLKDAPRQEIWDTIRLAYSGESTLSGTVAAKVAQSFSRPQLSDREKEVLHLLAQGRSNKEIGTSLFICEGTVKNHVKSILTKLDAMGRTEAIAIATRRGLILT